MEECVQVEPGYQHNRMYAKLPKNVECYFFFSCTLSSNELSISEDFRLNNRKTVIGSFTRRLPSNIEYCKFNLMYT